MYYRIFNKILDTLGHDSVTQRLSIKFLQYARVVKFNLHETLF